VASPARIRFSKPLCSGCRRYRVVPAADSTQHPVGSTLV
jgi:hypothetical protein